MHVVDAAIVVSFVLWAVASGLASARLASRGLEEYFLAGRALGGAQAGLSMAATQFAADTPLLVTGLVAAAGVFSLWRLWIYAVAFLFLGYVLAPCWRRAAVLTDAELSEVRYSGKAAVVLRAIKAVYFGLVFNCVVLAMVMYAATRIAEPFLLWHRWLPAAVVVPLARTMEGLGLALASGAGGDLWIRSADNAISLVLILTVTAFYSTAGGLRAVVRTDLVQIAVALVGTAVFAYYVVDAAGGRDALGGALERVLAHHPSAMTKDELLAFTPGQAHEAGAVLLAVIALQWLLQINADGTGYLAQRCMACRSDRDATRATLVFTWTQVVVRSLLWLPIAIGLLVVFAPDGRLAAADFVAERETTYVRGMAELLPVGAKGLLLVSMLAALASTLDTHMNWGASYLTHDLYGRFYCRWLGGREPDGRAQVRVARASNVVIATIAVIVMFQLDSIQTAWKASLLLGAGLGVVLVLRWLWWRISAAAEIAAIVVSLVLAPAVSLWLGSPDEPASLLTLLTVAVVATAAAVAASLVWPDPDRASLVAFYRRAHPPGLWAPVAREAGETAAGARVRLARGLGRTVTGALAAFSALVGVGSWLVGGTVPVWFPVPALWTPTLVAASVVLLAADRRLRS